MTADGAASRQKKRAARPAALQKAYRGKHSFVAERSKPFTGPWPCGSCLRLAAA